MINKFFKKIWFAVTIVINIVILVLIFLYELINNVIEFIDNVAKDEKQPLAVRLLYRIIYISISIAILIVSLFLFLLFIILAIGILGSIFTPRDYAPDEPRYIPW